MQMPIQFGLGSSDIAFYDDANIAEFEAMDLEAQLDKLQWRLQVKSRAVNEALDIIKIWQTTEVSLDDGKEVVDQLMKDLTSA